VRVELSQELPVEVVDVYREAFGAGPYYEGEAEVARTVIVEVRRAS
jgi:hypothetical protein